VRARAEFAVAAVRVAGAEARVAEDVRALAQVPIGANIWDIDLDGVRERVLRHDWVAEADVRRELPGDIIVTVEERRALATLNIGGVPYGVDKRGQPFAPLGAAQASALPRITGFDPTAQKAQPARGEPEELGDIERAAQALRLLRRAAALVRVAGRRRRLTEMRIDPVAGLTVLTEELGAVPVTFGWKRWRDKERRLSSVVELWAGREAELEAVSLVFRDRVVVQLRSGASIDAAAGRGPAGT
jgi:cell division protein FtsQ